MPVILRLAAVCAIGLAVACPTQADYRPAVTGDQTKKESFGEKWLREQWAIARQRQRGKLLFRLRCEQDPLTWEDGFPVLDPKDKGPQPGP
jgi:hypothetical protein